MYPRIFGEDYPRLANPFRVKLESLAFCPRWTQDSQLHSDLSFSFSFSKVEMWLMVLFLLGVLVISAVYVLNKPTKEKGKPLPGKRSLPLIGESFELLRSDPYKFFEEHRKRYGDVFFSNLFGSFNILTATPDAATFFLNSRKCSPSNLTTFKNIIGPENLSQAEGALHLRYRRVILASMRPEALKHHVERMDQLAIDLFSSWKHKDVIHTKEEGSKFTYDVITGFVCEQLKPSSAETVAVMNDVARLDRGLLQFPINIPFTPYHSALQARKRVHKFLDNLITQRKKEPVQPNDLLGVFLEDTDDTGNKLSNQQIEDNVLACLFAGQHTTATTLIWMMKYLHENPDELHKLQAEQQNIARRKQSEGYSLTWTDTREMPLTLRAIHETLRLSNLIVMILRALSEDVEYKGFFLRKGWQLKILTSTIHLNDDVYPEALKFKPSRFEVAPKQGTFLAFGAGSRMCPGSELAKLELLILMHRLLTTYRWEPLNPDAGTHYWGLPMPEDGYQVKVQPI